MQRWPIIALGLGLVILVLFPRLLNLDTFRSPDEDRWMANTNGFTTKLAHGRLADLVQQPHPGLTTQWLGALTIRSDNWAIRKLPLVIGQSLLILLLACVFGRLWGKTAGVFVVLALAGNPLLYAHTRIYAMDSLLALFSALALGLLLLWRQRQNERLAWRYLIASAFATAAATLSKLPGIALLPIVLGALFYWSYREKKLLIPTASDYFHAAPGKHPVFLRQHRVLRRRGWKALSLVGITTHYQLQTTGLWLLALLVSLIIILPSLAIAPGNVIGDFLEFFRSDEYQEFHHLGPYYYLGTLAFFSAPLHALALIILGWLIMKRKISLAHREHLVILLLFAILFVVQMSIGAKKGDRYILPSFVILDVIAAFVIAKMYRLQKNASKKYSLLTTHYVLLTVIVWQFAIIWQTHPHTLAYVNPLTRPWFGDRRHGWGEGLDLAAAYLNQKTDAAALKIATYYPSEVGPYFLGQTVPAHQHDEPGVDYIIIYRAMFERGQAWETDVVQQYSFTTPDKIIELSGVPMIWIYPRR